MRWIERLDELAERTASLPGTPSIEVSMAIRDALARAEDFLSSDSKSGSDFELCRERVTPAITRLNRLKDADPEQARVEMLEHLQRHLEAGDALDPHGLAELLALWASHVSIDTPSPGLSHRAMAAAGRLAAMRPHAASYLRVTRRAATLLRSAFPSVTLNLLREGLDIAHALDDAQEIEASMYTLANFYAFSSKTPRLAMAYYSKLHEKAEGYLAGTLEYNIAALAIGIGDLELASDYCARYAEATDRSESVQERWRAAHLDAALCWLRDRPEKADARFLEAIALSRAAHSLSLFLTIVSYLLFLLESERREKALAILRRYDRETRPKFVMPYYLHGAYESHLRPVVGGSAELSNSTLLAFEADVRALDTRGFLTRPYWATPDESGPAASVSAKPS